MLSGSSGASNEWLYALPVVVQILHDPEPVLIGSVRGERLGQALRYEPDQIGALHAAVGVFINVLGVENELASV
jgi:hypothetical protein